MPIVVEFVDAQTFFKWYLLLFTSENNINIYDILNTTPDPSHISYDFEAFLSVY
jgi:hypothetical protein